MWFSGVIWLKWCSSSSEEVPLVSRASMATPMAPSRIW